MWEQHYKDVFNCVKPKNFDESAIKDNIPDLQKFICSEVDSIEYLPLGQSADIFAYQMNISNIHMSRLQNNYQFVSMQDIA